MSKENPVSDPRKVRTHSSNDRENEMLKAVAEYHGVTKSATLRAQVAKEFWRVYPHGTPQVPPVKTIPG